ncbi:EamA/RhaT family transporter [Pseudoalteromonas piscicida]|uniref:EamA/RhaT family transporter n=1 Tax=Pseudoalteromonas piscicida TaxID=43662 RepID=A0AAQ2EY09_PSEO7|nr:MULTISPECIES: DMT family transporter [Pseudoalteromonas]KJY87097.1 membrane protein [Pseudoalteromonas piscicida]TMN41567.1 EamA/RhaT family transporter [Pseudoalteromonas piscicida]TMN44735.1 EamA/RhaT family transporter [Pseudoalteromonas piscicida]TMN49034.1 EamA/RhaT family transporter [Pseudoalteromonas piscicida]TMN51385.1 EamA/RhaT family transporter [Pseudoalteromonas piscicida]
MKNLFLYAITVLIWGSTWLAIEYQLGSINEFVSLFYRFGLAAVCMWAFVIYKRVPMRFSRRDHGFFILLALCNFGANYLFLYWAQAHLTSAMASIAFSLLLVVNIVNTKLFFAKPIAKRIYFGASLGTLGIVSLFWHDLVAFDLQSEAFLGLSLALLGTVVASLGNMVSVRNSNQQIDVMAGNAWGMLYSAVMLATYVTFSEHQFINQAPASYWWSLIYLSVFGTVIAFGCYFSLLKNIGPEKASYLIVLFPFVAVALSTLFEGFEWQQNTFIGFILVILGNAIVLTPLDRIYAWLSIRSPVRS